MYTTRVLAQSSTADMNKSHFRCQLSRPLTGVRSISLIQCNFGNTNPNIESGISADLTVLVGAATHGTAELGTGSYNHTEIMELLTTDMNRWGIGVFNMIYNPSTFKITIYANTHFTLRVTPDSILPLLGFLTTTNSGISHTADVPVRLNTNRGILVTVKGFERLDVPNIHCASSFYVPVYSSAGEISYVSQADLGDQTVHIHSEGVDLSYLDVSLRRSDYNREYTLGSDSSFLFEIKHN